MPPTPETEPELISTERLDLVLLDVPEVLAYEFVTPGVDLLAGKPFENPYLMLVNDLGPLQFRIAQVKADPSVNRWLLRVIVHRSANRAIGIINFHDSPNEVGMVEIGYRIAEPERRQGFAREAVLGMSHWAIADQRVHTLRASISPANIASRNLVAGLGFVEVGMQEDDIDGPEIIYELSAEHLRNNQV